MSSLPPPDPSSGLPRPGDVLAGKYEVERVIGSGAMGVVVAAMHLDLGERVALKFLLPQAAANAEVVARFAREARASAKIKSEHVARVTDVGKLENGEPYMVMEYLEGSDLADVVEKKGPLSVRDAVEHVIQACAAVAEAHALGIIHRDLKPANLFLANRPGGTPIVKVLDFGISKVLPPRDSAPSYDPSVTRTTAWLGSPLYMSPEQMTSAKNVDARTDVWSLGAILYELLTARPPFNADSLPELFAAILHSPPPALETARPDAPAGLGAIIHKALTRDREARYANVGELATALVPFAPSRARSAAERAVAVTEAAGLVVTTGTRRPLDSTLGVEVISPAFESPASSQMSSPPETARVSAPPRPSATLEMTVGTSGAVTSSPAPKSTAIGSARSAPSQGFGAVILVFGALIALTAIGAGAYLWIKILRGAPEPTEVAPIVAVTAAPATTSAASAAASVVAAPIGSAPAVVASAPIAVDAGVGAIVDAGALRDSGAPKLFGHLPSSSASPSAAPTPTHAAGIAPPGSLNQEKCFATMPDGSHTLIPCH